MRKAIPEVESSPEGAVAAVEVVKEVPLNLTWAAMQASMEKAAAVVSQVQVAPEVVHWMGAPSAVWISEGIAVEVLLPERL